MNKLCINDYFLPQTSANLVWFYQRKIIYYLLLWLLIIIQKHSDEAWWEVQINSWLGKFPAIPGNSAFSVQKQQRTWKYNKIVEYWEGGRASVLRVTMISHVKRLAPLSLQAQSPTPLHPQPVDPGWVTLCRNVSHVGNMQWRSRVICGLKNVQHH